MNRISIGMNRILIRIFDGIFDLTSNEGYGLKFFYVFISKKKKEKQAFCKSWHTFFRVGS
jgi:hypothetical protein